MIDRVTGLSVFVGPSSFILRLIVVELTVANAKAKRIKEVEKRMISLAF